MLCSPTKENIRI